MLTWELEGSLDITIGELFKDSYLLSQFSDKLQVPYAIGIAQHDNPIRTIVVSNTYLVKTNDRFKENF